jgi:hypothetical protein
MKNLTGDMEYLADQLDKQIWEPALLPSAPLNPTEKFDPSIPEGAPTTFDQFLPTDVPLDSKDSRDLIIFPSSNDLGIPDLLPNMLYDGPLPSVVWAEGLEIKEPSNTIFIFGSNKVGGPEPQRQFVNGICCFFTNDERFERVWNQPLENAKRMVDQKWGGVMTPDFSTWWNMPLALKLYAIYRARWCGRLWQEHGVKIIPGLVTGGNPARAQMELAGIPRNPPVVAFECRAGFDGDKADRDAKRRVLLSCLNTQLEYLNPGAVIVYGGKGHADWLDGNLFDGPKYVYTEQWAAVRQRVSDTFKYEKDQQAASEKAKTKTRQPAK